jgi:hypothetical protein
MSDLIIGFIGGGVAASLTHFVLEVWVKPWVAERRTAHAARRRERRFNAIMKALGEKKP